MAFTPAAGKSKKITATTEAQVLFDNAAGGTTVDGITTYVRQMNIYNAGPALAFIRVSYDGEDAVIDEDQIIPVGVMLNINGGSGGASGASVSIVAADDTVVYASLGSSDATGVSAASVEAA